jgi:hypothetical protein
MAFPTLGDNGATRLIAGEGVAQCRRVWFPEAYRPNPRPAIGRGSAAHPP